MTIERDQFDLANTLPVVTLNNALSAARESNDAFPAFTKEEFLARVGLLGTLSDGQSLAFRLAGGHVVAHQRKLAKLRQNVRDLSETACRQANTDPQQVLAEILATTALRQLEREGNLCAFGMDIIELSAERQDIVPPTLLQAVQQQPGRSRRNGSRNRNEATEDTAAGFTEGLTDGMTEHLNRRNTTSSGSSRGSGGGSGWDCDPC